MIVAVVLPLLLGVLGQSPSASNPHLEQDSLGKIHTLNRTLRRNLDIVILLSLAKVFLLWKPD